MDRLQRSLLRLLLGQTAGGQRLTTEQLLFRLAEASNRSPAQDGYCAASLDGELTLLQRFGYLVATGSGWALRERDPVAALVRDDPPVNLVALVRLLSSPPGLPPGEAAAAPRGPGRHGAGEGER